MNYLHMIAVCIRHQCSPNLLRIVLRQNWCDVVRHHLCSMFGFYMLNHKWHIPITKRNSKYWNYCICVDEHVCTHWIRHVMCLRHSMFINPSNCTLSITKSTVYTYIHVWAILAVKLNRQEHHIQKHALGNDYYNPDVLTKICFSLTSRKVLVSNKIKNKEHTDKCALYGIMCSCILCVSYLTSLL